MTRTQPASIQWQLPPGKPDWLFGSGATALEKTLVYGFSIVATAAVLGYAAIADATEWHWWHYVVAALIALDLFGGVVANALGSAKRAHHADIARPREFSGRLVRSPVWFAAVHVQPILVWLVFPGSDWWFGLAWYAVILAGVTLVRFVPLYLERPVALAWAAAVAVASPLVPAPDGFAWVPVILALKLVVAHAVREEPYRPREDS